MKALLEDGKSIFLQICDLIEDDILGGALQEEGLIPSTNQLAAHFSINPATVAKGVNLLVDEGILYKKRGIGMCVQVGAREKVLGKRKQRFFQTYIEALLHEADKLQISKNELIQMIEKGEQHA